MTSAPPNPKPLLQRTEQLAAAGLSAIALLFLVVHLWRESQRQGGTIDIDQAAPLTATFKVDLNTAPWPEIAELPNIGEKVAKELVAERERHGPFRNIKDVQRRVKGIGARLLERITPYLQPLSDGGS